MLSTAKLRLPRNVHLTHGSHSSYGEGACALELVDFLDRKRRGVKVTKADKLTDSPACCCPVLGAFCRSWNDALDDDDRNRILKPFLLRLLDTKSTPEVEQRRAWMATDWLVREHASAWLELANLSEHAAALRALPALTCKADYEASKNTIEAARSAGAAARAAAGAAAGAAAWDAAWAAAWDAARAAAGAAARAAAWAAARAAAGAALKDTTKRMQTSACDLLDRMIAVSE